ncbi:hypothetical protein [Fulvivirga lutimaris]|uniref:hypothetical protein n=1 Tax=Fulvivirga lutimaris TaxID=1819566 RepID=UPI0012BC9B1B|nr:hypothetical protein [Fulvivirga lutimaris]MTI40270.1 hypothetical protein [Fulvivirga lutimaris]
MRTYLTIFIFTFLFIGCNSSVKNTEDKQDFDVSEYEGILMPKLSTSEKEIWNFYNGKSEATLKRGVQTFKFELSNYSKYTNPEFLENHLQSINYIDFKYKSNDGVLIIYNPTIKDSIGILSLNLDSMALSRLEYEVNMNLKFRDSDSTFTYRGIVDLID